MLFHHSNPLSQHTVVLRPYENATPHTTLHASERKNGKFHSLAVGSILSHSSQWQAHRTRAVRLVPICVNGIGDVPKHESEPRK